MSLADVRAVLRRRYESAESREERRLREIDALRAAGVATWEEEREYVEIVRKRVKKEETRA